MNIPFFELNISNCLLWVFLAWHYALRCGFISDDHAVIAGRMDIIPDEERAKLQKEKDEGKGVEPYWVKVFNDGIVMYYINAVLYRLGCRNKPLVWHVLSLGVHLINVWLLWFFFRAIVGDTQAVVIAFIWGINPMLNQDTVWCSGRPYSIATLLVLVAMIFHQNPLIFLPLYGLAVITNISIALVPILVKMLYPDAWQSNLYLIMMICAGFPFILWKFHRRFTGALVIDRENFRFKKRRFNMLARVYAYYLWTAIAPVRMGWYHQAGFKYNKKWELFNIWTACGYAWVIYCMTAGVGGWWFLLGLIPNINAFSTNSFVQDRYVYFAYIGLALMVAPILVQYPQLVLIFGAFFIIRSYMYSRHMKDDEKLYRENWRNHPRSDYAVNNLSYFLISRKRAEEARVIILHGIQIDKNNKMLWYNLGVTWAMQGDLPCTLR